MSFKNTLLVWIRIQIKFTCWNCLLCPLSLFYPIGFLTVCVCVCGNGGICLGLAGRTTVGQCCVLPSGATHCLVISFADTNSSWWSTIDSQIQCLILHCSPSLVLVLEIKEKVETRSSVSSWSFLRKLHCGFPRPAPMGQSGCFLTPALLIHNDTHLCREGISEWMR